MAEEQQKLQQGYLEYNNNPPEPTKNSIDYVRPRRK